MKQSARLGLLVAMLASPFAAWAGHWVYQSDHTLRWHDDGRYLHLSADEKGGVDVLGVTPAGLWGLNKGDTIVQADGHAVTDVAGLLALLRAHGDARVPLMLKHDGVERSVMLDAGAQALVPAPVAATAAAAPAAPVSPSGPSRLVLQSDDSLRWRSEGRRVHLVTSKDKSGVDVVTVIPEALWGLTKGDEIVAVNGQPAQSVAQFLGRLRDTAGAPVSLTVRRAGAQQTVMLASEARELAISTHAPSTPPADGG